MKATKTPALPGQRASERAEPVATRFYRGKPHRVPMLAEIARHCRLLVWELTGRVACGDHD
jgi:hypothetical protein